MHTQTDVMAGRVTADRASELESRPADGKYDCMSTGMRQNCCQLRTWSWWSQCPLGLQFGGSSNPAEGSAKASLFITLYIMQTMCDLVLHCSFPVAVGLRGVGGGGCILRRS